MKHIGILGDGQLGRMLALAGQPLGYQFRFFCGQDPKSVEGLGEIFHGDLNHLEDLKKFAQDCDVITYETENIPTEPIEFLLRLKKTVYPGIESLRTCQDRWLEKNLFQKLNIPTNRFLAAQDAHAVAIVAQSLKTPCLIKSRRFGYDGKNQHSIRTSKDIDSAQLLNNSFYPAIGEEFVHFDFEISRIAARSANGDIEFYPMAQNTHRNGVLLWSEDLRDQISAERYAELERLSRDYVSRILTELQHVGVLAVEFFVLGSKLLANEIAPRVHNSGHWTIEACATSQFTNHLLAISGAKLGSTQVHSHWVMGNLLGIEPNYKAIENLNQTYLHWYNKSVKPGRKVGHITALASSAQEQERCKQMLAPLIHA